MSAAPLSLPTPPVRALTGVLLSRAGCLMLCLSARAHGAESEHWYALRATARCLRRL